MHQALGFILLTQLQHRPEGSFTCSISRDFLCRSISKHSFDGCVWNGWMLRLKFDLSKLFLGVMERWSTSRVCMRLCVFLFTVTHCDCDFNCPKTVFVPKKCSYSFHINMNKGYISFFGVSWENILKIQVEKKQHWRDFLYWRTQFGSFLTRGKKV